MNKFLTSIVAVTAVAGAVGLAVAQPAGGPKSTEKDIESTGAMRPKAPAKPMAAPAPMTSAAPMTNSAAAPSAAPMSTSSNPPMERAARADRN